ncbi:sugar dehydrogenase complex small subunit [Serratia sp. ASV30]|uniref:sugar dehydrogenase complex small subunit n=1 Tax=Serratia sp. ASV30 TaxID=2795127 RepID=UPI0018ED3CEB|nr:sugar dehydrogenase complex small subunit [Serratia sp. ASV30]
MYSRRRFLTVGAALTGFAVFKPSLSWGRMPSESSDAAIFIKLSVLLTNGKKMNPVIALRALNCLQEEDPSFQEKMQLLANALSVANILSADELNNHLIMTAPTGDTAKKIISAWYLGYTGTPVSLRASDNTRFVSYTDAFAYAPTLDATVIPTYSRGKTNYWVQPPITLNSD